MLAPACPANENQRLKTLQSLNVLDTPPEQRFDRYTHAASQLFNVPIALVSLIDANRQWFKSCVGLTASETDREVSFCGHAILQDEVFVVADASLDPRFADNPLVTGQPDIRFYAGCPLRHPNGSMLGTLCLIDQKPRPFDAQDAQILKELALLVEIELLQQASDSMMAHTQLSTREGFLAIAEPCLALCCKNDVPATVVFLFVKGLLSASKDPAHYLHLQQQLAAQFKQHFHSSNVLGHYDDSSFVALLTNTSVDTAEHYLADLAATSYAMLASNQCSLLFGTVSAQPDDDIKRLLYSAFADLHAF